MPAHDQPKAHHIGGSLLPSSEPRILRPIPFRDGFLQVRPDHRLVFSGPSGETVLASHPNGYSCHALARRSQGVFFADAEASARSPSTGGQPLAMPASLPAQAQQPALGYEQRPDYTGQQFTVARYGCTWRVLRYHRGGNWVCQEPDHGTTCHFHESEILPGIGEYALREEREARQAGETLEDSSHE